MLVYQRVQYVQLVQCGMNHLNQQLLDPMQDTFISNALGYNPTKLFHDWRFVSLIHVMLKVVPPSYRLVYNPINYRYIYHKS